MHPDYVNESRQKEQKIVDLAVIKRGLNFHGMDANQLKKENAEIDREREMQQRGEGLVKVKDTKQTVTKGTTLNTNVPAGEDLGSDVMKMAEVASLPDDVDAIIQKMKTVDFAI